MPGGVSLVGAWATERGRCHRFVYDPDGKPGNCPEPTVTSGWRRDGPGRWYAVDACAEHSSQLMSRPGTQNAGPLARPQPNMAFRATRGARWRS